MVGIDLKINLKCHWKSRYKEGRWNKKTKDRFETHTACHKSARLGMSTFIFMCW